MNMNHTVIKGKKNSAGKTTITYLKLLYIAFVIKKSYYCQKNQTAERNRIHKHECTTL